MNKIRTMSVLAILAIIFSFATVRPVTAACASSVSPRVTTDKIDYGPFETVTISGSGFGCGEVLTVMVTAPDGNTLSGDGTGSPGPDSMTTDENGEFLLSYHLAGTLPNGGTYTGQQGAYTVEVMNSSNAVLASTVFTDGGSAFHSCAVTTSGGAKCWGYGGFGQLGDGLGTNSALPVDVFGLTSGIAQISTGGQHTCALTTGSGAKCWGQNLFGQLGDGTFTYIVTTSVDVSGLASGVSQISAGGFHTCALTTSGSAKCWGANTVGQLGDGTVTSSALIVDVSGLTSGVAQVSAGYNHTCALTTSGGVKCWGSNSNGQLGDGTFADSAIPVNVSGLTSGIIQISTGQYHTCALTNTGGAKCWGYNFYGQLGDGMVTNSAAPVNVSGLASGVAQISAGYNHTCALTTTGGAKCWGRNFEGQLGNGTFTGSTIPVNVSGLTTSVAQMSVSAEHTCALTMSGGAKCWGRNYEGEIGDGTFTNSAMAVDVSGLSSGVTQLPDIFLGVINSNQPPTADAGGPYNGGEGTAIAMSGASASDPDMDMLTYSWSVDTGLCTFDDASAINPDLTCSDFGSFTATLSVDDGVNLPVSDDAAVTVIFNWAGFFQPVDNLPTWNSVRAGQAIPVKFSLGGDQGLNIFAAGYPRSEQITCNSNALVDGIEETVTAGSSSLTYDPGSHRYHYVWKTQKSWAGTCRQLVLKLVDGTTQRANFQFK